MTDKQTGPETVCKALGVDRHHTILGAESLAEAEVDGLAAAIGKVEEGGSIEPDLLRTQRIPAHLLGRGKQVSAWRLGVVRHCVS